VAIPHALGGPIGGTFFDLHGWLYGAIDAGEGLYSSRFASGAFVYVSMIAAILMSLGGMYLAFRLYAKPSEVPGAVVSRLGRVHRVIENRFYFDELYAATFGRALYWGGVLLHRVVDELAVQTLLVGSVASGTRLVGTVLRQLHNGDVQRYVALTVMSIAVVVYLLVR
jgi:NADH-quinone oxidoreductase subunit L